MACKKSHLINKAIIANLPFTPTALSKVKPKKIRLLIRDGNKCWLCGDGFDLTIADPHHHDFITVDHFVRRRENGSNDLKNLKLAHRLCNNIRD